MQHEDGPPCVREPLTYAEQALGRVLRGRTPEDYASELERAALRDSLDLANRLLYRMGGKVNRR